jgi:hypothetical protein
LAINEALEAAAQIADREESRLVASTIRSLKWAGDKRIQNEVDSKPEQRALTA